MLLPIVSMLMSEEARAGVPTVSATVFATVRINTLEVSIEALGSVVVGEQLDVVATLRNVGSTKIMRAKATIHLPILETGTAFTLRGQEDKNAGAILPGREKKVRWKLVAKTPGNYIVMVTAVGKEEVSDDLLDAHGISPFSWWRSKLRKSSHSVTRTRASASFATCWGVVHRSTVLSRRPLAVSSAAGS